MEQRLIDANALCEEFKERQKAALRWKEKALLDGDEERIIRSDATLAFLTEVKLTIDNAPTIERSKDKWIPVSERLPEKEGEYLLWGKITEDEEEYSFIGNYDEGAEQFGLWHEQFDNRSLASYGSEFYEYSRVIAWQPLPEAYKEAEK